jgi:hypothetical protein
MVMGMQRKLLAVAVVTGWAMGLGWLGQFGSLQAQDPVALLPAETTLVVRLDVASLRTASAYQELVAGQAERHAAILERVRTATGIDPLAIRHVWLAGIRHGEGALLVEAEVDVDALRATAAANPECTLTEMPGTSLAVTFPDRRDRGRTRLAVVMDDGLVVAGSPGYVEQVLAVAAGTQDGLSGESRERVAAATGETGLLRAALLALPAEAARKPMLAGMTGASLAADLDDALDLHLEMSLADPRQAEALAQVIGGMLALQQLAAPLPPDAPVRERRRDLLRRNLCGSAVVASTEDGLRLDARLDAEAIAQILAEMDK